MGSRYDFTYTGCGYHAEDSGGEDWGMVAVVTTISCHDCWKRRDVEVGEYGQVTRESEPCSWGTDAF